MSKREIVDYSIECEQTVEDLIKEVKIKIESGWELLGSSYCNKVVRRGAAEFWIHQTMIKYKKIESDLKIEHHNCFEKGKTPHTLTKEEITEISKLLEPGF